MFRSLIGFPLGSHRPPPPPSLARLAHGDCTRAIDKEVDMERQAARVLSNSSHCMLNRDRRLYDEIVITYRLRGFEPIRLIYWNSPKSMTTNEQKTRDEEATSYRNL